jgi:hypothetical protein
MTLYGFFFNSCIYESAEALVSLHETKAGAYRAMVADQRAEWERARDAKLVDSIRGVGRRRGYFDYLGERRSQHFCVKPVEVLP